MDVSIGHRTVGLEIDSDKLSVHVAGIKTQIPTWVRDKDGPLPQGELLGIDILVIPDERRVRLSVSDPYVRPVEFTFDQIALNLSTNLSIFSTILETSATPSGDDGAKSPDISLSFFDSRLSDAEIAIKLSSVGAGGDSPVTIIDLTLSNARTQTIDALILHHPQIEWVIWDHCRPTAFEIRELLTGLNVLEDLSLVECGITEEVLESIPNGTRLKSLDLTSNRDCVAGLSELLKLRNLEFLNITGTSASDYDIGGLRSHPALTHLVMIDCDANARIGEVLASIPNLEDVTISNPTRARDLDGFLEALSGSGSLKSVTVDPSNNGGDSSRSGKYRVIRSELRSGPFKYVKEGK